jgi:hypothetical protein
MAAPGDEAGLGVGICMLNLVDFALKPLIHVHVVAGTSELKKILIVVDAAIRIIILGPAMLVIKSETRIRFAGNAEPGRLTPLLERKRACGPQWEFLL